MRAKRIRFISRRVGSSGDAYALLVDAFVDNDEEEDFEGWIGMVRAKA